MPDLVLSTTAPVDADVDAVVLTTFEGDAAPAFEAVDAALDGLLGEMRTAKDFTGKFGERPVVRTLGRLRAPRVVLLGLGKPAQLDSYRLVNPVQMATTGLRSAGAARVAVYVDPRVAETLGNGAGPGSAATRVARLVATGALLGNWESGMAKNRRDTADERRIERVEVAGVEGEGVAAALDEASVLATAQNRVRTWVATPSNRLTPTLLAAEAEELFKGTGLEVDVLRKDDLVRLRMGALLGVAQGSEEPPVMVCVRWDGGTPDGPRLGLVGKGITFDTGGVSIKPAGGMDAMKNDMGGGAAVLGAMYAIATLGIKANVIGVVPATENMVGGRAYKPGDVLESRAGITIEVMNTDAEGRIILADGLAQAREMGATHLVDTATLTGAIVVALGHVATGLMASDPDLARRIHAASAAAGDRVTEFPLHPEYDCCLTSEVADIKNLAGREGGAISAAVFLREFSGDLPWAHLDIAGTAWNDQGDLKTVPSGPSATPLRTFVELARSFAEDPPVKA